MNFVTLDQVKEHLRIDGNTDDTALDMYILAASSSVKNYLKSASPYALVLDEDFNPVFDADGNPEYEKDIDGNRVISTVVQKATLLMTGYLYLRRDNDDEKDYETGYLPRPVTALLYPLRDPAMR